MADQIIQELGFDAVKAIDAINATNTALQGLNATLSAFANSTGLKNNGVQTQLNALQKTVKQTAADYNAAGAAAASFQAQGGAAVRAVNDDTTRLNNNLRLIGRVLQTQLLVRGFSAVRSIIRDSVRETVEFQKAVAEISTISPDTTGFREIQDSLKVTAETFGFDILDAAEARYQLLSNQVKDAATNNEGFVASAKLARATNSALSDSVSLVSSVLNAYGDSVTEAEEVSGLLFKTIEQGRTRASELANSFGTVLPLANNLGVQFNEVAASLAVITRQGTTSAVALTQIRSLLNKLLKPSEALQEVFNNLGFQTAAQGIQQFGGLIPLLQKINAEVSGNSALQAELFNNVRGLNGLLNIFAENGNQINGVLQELGLTGSQAVDELNEAFNKVDETPAVEFERQVARLKNELLTFGELSLPAVNAGLDSLNKALDIGRENLGAMSVAVAGTVGAFSASRIAALGATTQFGAIATVAGPAAIAIGAVTAAFLGYQAIVSRLESSAAQRDIEVLNEVLAEQKKALEENGEAFAKLEDNLKSTETDLQSFSNNVRSASASALNAIREENEAFVSSTSDALDSFLSSRKEVLKELERAAADAQKSITDSQERESSIRQKIADLEFDNSIAGFDDLGKAFRQSQRSQTTVQDAKDLLRSGDVEQASETIKRAVAQAEEALKSAEASKNVTAIANANSNLNSILNSQLGLEKEIQATERARKAEAEKQANIERKNLENLKQTVADLKNSISIFGAEGQILTPDERRKAEADFNNLLATLQQQALGGNFDLSETLGLLELESRLQNQFQSLQAKLTIDRSDLQSQLDDVSSKLRLTVPVDILLEAQQAGLIDKLNLNDPLTSFQEVVKATTDELGGLNKQFLEVQNAVTKLDKAEEAARRLLAPLEDTRSVLGELAGVPGIQSIVEQFNQLTSQATITDQQITDFIANIRALNDQGAIDVPGLTRPGETQSINDIEAVVKRLQEAKFEATGLKVQFDQARFDQLNNISGALDRFRDSADQAGLLAINTGEAASQTSDLQQRIDVATGGVTQLAESYDGVIDRINQAIARQQELNATVSAGGAPQPRMFGGFTNLLSKGGVVKYLAGGGFAPRGTDTVPAMLSPGEFVVNASAARKFSAQLVAMNAGVQPTYRQEGGTVVNNSVNVGDIQISGSGDPEEVGRAVSRRLRREFRRGTSPRF